MPPRPCPGLCRRASGGFTYLGLLFAILILGFALATAGQLYGIDARRGREAQLLWVGQQYRQALASYYVNGPAGLHELPRTLEDLLEDRRGAALARHLRRLYPDPMTGRADWDVERAPDGSIIGVRSRALGRPIKQAGFAAGQESFLDADCYCDWRFIYVPDRRLPAASATP